MKPSSFLLVWLLALLGSTQSFKPFFSLDGQSVTHSEITERAVLRKTAEVCEALALAAGRDFSLTISDSLTANQVQRACSPDGSAPSVPSFVMFHTAIADMYLNNGAVDLWFFLSARHHFDDESFQSGRELITAGVSAVKQSIKMENFISGRIRLGQTLHTLQDFYSHSNWVELGNRVPYSTLIRPDLQMNNLADSTTITCRSCEGGDCTDNLKPELLLQGQLTSGYFSLFSSKKPAGKCSHGGLLDQTSRTEPFGGINKDTVGSNHGPLHHAAASIAMDATAELLDDIRSAAGDRNFLRLMGLSQSPVLCLVVDTTGSMSDDIIEVKRASFSLIDSRRGGPQEPSGYILVPFNDPGFGPLLSTADADVFKERINELTAEGGGDIPELCLSGLQLALTAAPPYSEIFVFTDAPAKDVELRSTVTALIESSKSVVTFMLTGSLGSRRRRRRGAVGGTSTRMAQSDAQLYRDLAQASGGQAIEVTKARLSQALGVIDDITAGAVVTLFQVVRDPGTASDFTFTVDGSLENMTVYFTGDTLLTFNITCPTGVSQPNAQDSGPLGSVSLVGNLWRFSVSPAVLRTGSWVINVAESTQPYSVKVIGYSSLNFIFDFVEAFSGPHGGFTLKPSRPLAGANASLLVVVTGSDTVKVNDIILVEDMGSSQINTTVQSLGGANFLVTVDSVPRGTFAVLLRGEDVSSLRRTTNAFQRQASTQVTTSRVSVNTQANISVVEPGSTVSVPFNVTFVNGTVDTAFFVQATTDRGFPTSISMGDGGAVGVVTLDVPSDATSGSDVTLSINAQDSGATDLNYAVLRLAVVAKVTDFTRPLCQVISVGSCPLSLCDSARWELTVVLTDGPNGTGIQRLTVAQGNGTLNTSSLDGAPGENRTLAAYSATCCSPAVTLVAVDNAGNVGTCSVSAKTAGSLETSTAPVANGTTLSDAVTTSTGGTGRLTPFNSLWLGALAFLLVR